jgi:hypothetical protein
MGLCRKCTMRGAWELLGDCWGKFPPEMATRTTFAILLLQSDLWGQVGRESMAVTFSSHPTHITNRSPCRRIDGTCWQWCLMVWFPLQAPWTRAAGNGSPFNGNLIRENRGADSMLWATEHLDFWDHWPHAAKYQGCRAKCFNPTPIKAADHMHMQLIRIYQNPSRNACFCPERCNLLPTQVTSIVLQITSVKIG